MLALAGITTVSQLRQLGAVEAYVRTKAVAPAVSLNLLWGLEAAITGEPWQVVARKHRMSLLLALEARENQG
ncbi:MAG: TfoX/Sxy family DNA transformation protein [Gammaproteobacteria bacterium]|nr:TfoX/Sxy family DNA transformation protein [Gammaproteobacteria bacterium]